ncbi:hypothetical protein [Cumulibacter manganitolerans]|uniref:hypothetical protein n=1 Tax=Cumulibacter manganitolerans TaxID=1884992 RepID=UPI0012974464|nr:hypothetical protein [Cumulibacter manganitolerans]
MGHATSSNGPRLAAGLVIGLGGTAWAGEYTGNNYGSTQGPAHAKSECVYSGLDAPDSIENNPPGFNDDWLTIHGTQSYGQFVSQGYKSIVPSPGDACNPTKPPLGG